MPKYIVSWTEEDWYSLAIDAESSQDALDKFSNRDYDPEDVVHTGSELQDSIEVEEI